MIRVLAVLAALWVVVAGPGLKAQDLSALARMTGASLDEDGSGLDLAFDLSQPVPWRLFTVDNPARLVIDFNRLTEAVDLSGSVGEVLVAGLAEDGWSRLVLTLPGPFGVAEAAMGTMSDGRARLDVALVPVTQDVFAQTARAVPQSSQAPIAQPDHRPIVVIDPGHGGLDPGAEAGELNEKVLMLAIARELEEALIRGGVFDVALTREVDEFVPLESRISRARDAGADVFVSLHADELPEGAGDASGITVYTLDAEASDLASQRLAERHDKGDLVGGVTDTAPGDEIALVLMELARRDTAPRSEALASELRDAFVAEGLPLAGRPLRSAAFSVLKAPDIPSVLIELGFLSSEKDRARLTDPVWRAAAISAMESALQSWWRDDRVRDGLLRQ